MKKLLLAFVLALGLASPALACPGQGSANTVCAAPSGSAGVERFRAVVNGDLPSGIDAAKIGGGSVSTTEFNLLDGVTVYGQSIFSTANEAAFKALVNLEAGVDYQAFDAELTALASTTSAADKLPYFTGSGTATVTDLTAAARSILDDASVGAIRTTLGVGTGDSPQFTAIELSHATANTLAASGGHMTIEAATVWDSGNDGSGSTLDADLLDGLSSGSFQPIDADLTAFAANVYAANATAAAYVDFREDTDNGSNRVRLSGAQSTADVTVTLPASTDTLVGKDTTDTLTNKTLTNPAFSGATSDMGTVTTIDINGGTVDGAVIGGASAAAITGTTITANTRFAADANDGSVLGASGTGFSDLFLAEGAVIDWDSADATLTQTNNDITFAGITTFGVGTSTAVTLGTIETGAASDTTIARVSAGVISVEGVTILTTGTGQGLDADLTSFAANAYAANATAAAYVDFAEDTDNGSNRVRLSGAQSTGDVTITMPATTGTMALTSDLSAYQPVDTDLTTIAGLTATTNNFMQSVSSAWASRTPTQATATLDVFTSGANNPGLKGLVVAPVSGDETKFLRGDATWQTIPGGGDALTTNPLSQFASTTSAQFAGVISNESGTGLVILQTSPTLVTPVLGVATGTSLVLGHTAQLTLGNAVAGASEQFGTDAATGTHTLGEFSTTDATRAEFQFYKSGDAALATATVVATDEALGAMTWYGAQQTGTLSHVNPAARIAGFVDAAVTSGAGEDMPGRITFSTTPNASGTLTDRLILDSAGVLKPAANDGLALGNTSLQFSDLFLAEGGVINFDNGDATLTQVGDVVTLAGANLVTDTTTVNTTLLPDANDGAALGTTALQFSDLFLAEGGVLNWDNGDATLTQVGNVVTLAGADLVTDTTTVNTKLAADANDGAVLGASGTGFSDLFLAEGAVINWDAGDATLTQTADDVTFGGITTFGLGTSTVVTLGSMEVGAATDTTVARSAAGEISVEAKRLLNTGDISKRTLYVPAGALVGETTTGCASGSTELGNGIMQRTMDCDSATQEGAQFSAGMPKSWDESTVTARVDWTTTGTGDAIFLLSCVAISNDDVTNASFGTEVSVTDTVTAANDLMQSPETGAITCGGTPAENDDVFFRVQRDADAAGDTVNAADVKILGVRILYTTNALKDD